MIFGNLFKRKNIPKSLTFDVNEINTNPLWFHDAVKDYVLLEQQSKANKIDNYWAGNHDILNRPDYDMGDGKTYETAKVVLGLVKVAIKQHADFALGNPLSITGKQNVVSEFNKIFKRGNYDKINYQICLDTLKYGSCYEYCYRDVDTGIIKSTIISPTDAFPIYDSRTHEYVAFVEHWPDTLNSKNKNYIVYYPDHVEQWVDDEMIATNTNTTGLPIHYRTIDSCLSSNLFGVGMTDDLVGICNYIEYLLSKTDDSVTKNSLNPIYVSKGSLIGTDGNDDITGTVVNMEVDGDFHPTVTDLDSSTLKLLIEEYLKQFYVIAQIPSIGGQQNVANLSEVSLKLLYGSTEGKALETTKSLVDGFNQRFAYFRKLLELDGITFSDEDFDSIGITFSLRRPIDSKSAMEEMKIQHDMGAISKITVMENSSFVQDISEEIRRLEDEIHTPAKEGDNIISNNESNTQPTETIAVEETITKRGR